MMDPEGGGRAAAETKADRRRALVVAAYRRIATDGFEGLRTRDVAADVGVNIATLHYYFPTKEALIRSVIGHAMERFIDTMPGDGTPVDQLRGHLRALARLLRDDQQLWTVMGELVLRAPRDADLERIFRQTDAYWHRTLRDLIRRCIEQGAINPELDPDDLAALMIVAIKGLSLPTVAGFEPELADQVFRVARHLAGSREEAEDLVQETYARAFRSWRSFQPGTNLRAWLLRILTNLNIDRGRRKQRAPQTTPLEANDYYLYDKLAEADGAATDEERVVERLSQDDVVSALAAVPHDFRDVIVLVDIGDFSYQDAANILDIPIGTVMSRLHRGRRVLKRELADSVLEDVT